MEILLHQPEHASCLSEIYQRALRSARELYIVSAYLTAWDEKLRINTSCKRFRFIVGRDFGITRKDACIAVLKSLPTERKGDFLVADDIQGFHPKAMFWRDRNEKYFMLVGSSNLTHAAHEKNVEANVVLDITKNAFNNARTWIDWISDRCVPVSEDWLSKYVEAPHRPGKSSTTKSGVDTPVPVIQLKLPRVARANANEFINVRRRQLIFHSKAKRGLNVLFRRCASGEINSNQFYEQLPRYWGAKVGNLLQSSAWTRRGKTADFAELANAFMNIRNANDSARDDVVRVQLDFLHEARNPARKAFFSEMLCLQYPDKYPLLNSPVWNFLLKHKFRAARGSSEGSRYIDLAKKLRATLCSNPASLAKNLAELDILIWKSEKQDR